MKIIEKQPYNKEWKLRINEYAHTIAMKHRDN